MQKLNVQGLARRSPELMRNIVARPGYVYVSQDLAAGEPSITAHFSGDPNYRYAVYDGAGKAPYYTNDGMLMIDDIYLMTMSKSPVGYDKLRELFNTTFNGATFSQQWLDDREVVLREIKVLRQLIKAWALGLSYGMSAKTLVGHAYNAGYVLTPQVASQFHKSYWTTYSGVRAFARRLAAIAKQEGYIINPFGFRLVPEPHKAFNAFIQSSVSGLIAVLCTKLFSIADYAELVTIIHDELISEVPVDRVDDFKAASKLAVQSLNEDLGWSIDIRTGFVSGKDWYDAK